MKNGNCHEIKHTINQNQTLKEETLLLFGLKHSGWFIIPH